MGNILTLVAAIIGSSALTSAVTAWFLRRKTEAEARKTDAEADVSMAAELRRNVEFMMAQIQALTTQHTECALKLAAMQIDNEEKARTISLLRSDASKVQLEIEEMQRRLSELQRHVEAISQNH